MPYTRDQINSLISEQKRIKQAILAHQKEQRSPLTVFEQFVSEVLDKRIEALKKEVLNALQGAIPVKGIHYFDGEKGEKGEKGEDSMIPGEKGEDGKDADEGTIIKSVLASIPTPKDGRDGKNVSPKEARMILSELLSELSASDFGAATKKDMELLLKTYEGKSAKTLEKRLVALQDSVMRNYGGHGGKSVASAPKLYSLSSQLNGSKKSFTIPANIVITGVFGSSAPFVFEPTDYTGSGTTTITFGSGVDAPSALATGQTIIVQYV